MRTWLTRASLCLFLIASASTALGVTTAPPAFATASIVGSGSSFAGIELQEWAKEVGSPPYNLNVNYQSTSSGEGRQSFKDKVVNFAVTDIRYNSFDSAPPAPGTFEYIPVTAGGVAFMYNLQAHGFTAKTAPLRLSPVTVCGIFTGAIPYWDDPALQADNPGVTLPHVPVEPIVRSDPAGTNFVMEEYCIAYAPDLYRRFADQVTQLTGTSYPDNEPTSNWPINPPISGATGSDGAADAVASAAGADGRITAVETGYALQRGFPVAAVQNDSGAYVTPSDTAVATALSYATQQADGTHILNFKPGDPAAYNPSTYSYMLAYLQGATPAIGASVTQFAEYCLTIGQSEADTLGYASIGRQLIQYGLDHLQAIPGYVPPSAAELAAIPSQQQVAPQASAGGAGSTGGGGSSGTGGGSSGTTSTGTSSSRTTSSGAATGTAATSTGRTPSSGRTAATTTGAHSSTAPSALATLDPSASLAAQTGPLGQTGIEANILAAAGGGLLLAGEVWRRRARRAGAQ